jgi:hypothetical protein
MAVAIGLSATVAALARTFDGNTSQGLKAEVITDGHDQLKSLVLVFSTHCSDWRERTFSTGFVRPFDHPLERCRCRAGQDSSLRWQLLQRQRIRGDCRFLRGGSLQARIRNCPSEANTDALRRELLERTDPVPRQRLKRSCSGRRRAAARVAYLRAAFR